MADTVVAREGYELWRPNRNKAQAKTTKAVVAFVLLVSAALLAIVTIGGWERLQSPGVGAATIAWAGLYVAFAFLVMGWNRGILPVASALALIMVIFAAVAAPSWFARAKDGLSSPVLPEELLGLLTIVLIPVQLLLIVVAMLAFSQEWHVEEERPIEGGEYDDDDGGDTGAAETPDDESHDEHTDGDGDDDGDDDDSAEEDRWTPPNAG